MCQVGTRYLGYHREGDVILKVEAVITKYMGDYIIMEVSSDFLDENREGAFWAWHQRTLPRTTDPGALAQWMSGTWSDRDVESQNAETEHLLSIDTGGTMDGRNRVCRNPGSFSPRHWVESLWQHDCSLTISLSSTWTLLVGSSRLIRQQTIHH